MLTVIAAVVVFGILIGVHEAGHLVAAKLNHITVHEFAIGMGPKIFSHTAKSGTAYSLRLIPIGGYCAMEGEDEESDDEHAFCRRPAWARLIVVAAGAIMNLVLGYIACVIILSSAPQFYVPVVQSVLEEVPQTENSLMKDDQIVKINNTKINLQNDITFFLSRNKEKPVDVTVIRGGEKKVLHMTPYEKDGTYLLGFSPGVVDNHFYRTLKTAFYQEVFIMKVVLVTFGDLITGNISIKEASGPVGIVSEIGKATQRGFMDVVNLLAIISINLGLFNLLPIPALDGGRIVFILIEMIFRKRVPAKVEGAIHATGLMLLLLLMLFVTFNDVGRLGFVQNLFQ